MAERPMVSFLHYALAVVLLCSASFYIRKGVKRGNRIKERKSVGSSNPDLND